MKKKETLEEVIGKKVTDYCEKYKGTDKYNVAILAIEFGYQLAKKEPKLTTEFQEVIDFNDKIYNKETLEEAADKYENSFEEANGTESVDFIAGAKWQAEKMYSEEDMINFSFDTYNYISKLMKVPFNLISENRLHVTYNFKQFKKK
jgi:23S rRNA A2030 N6-methylase RlmJ